MDIQYYIQSIISYRDIGICCHIVQKCFDIFDCFICSLILIRCYVWIGTLTPLNRRCVHTRGFSQPYYGCVCNLLCQVGGFHLQGWDHELLCYFSWGALRRERGIAWFGGFIMILFLQIVLNIPWK